MRPSPHDLDRIHADALRDKAATALHGLCIGLTADRQLNEAEALFLDAWLREHAESVGRDPDAIDLLDLTGQILADGIVTADELEDLHGLLDTIVEHRRPDPARLMNRLNGIVHGIVADSVLRDSEVRALHAWLDAHHGALDPLAAELHARVVAALADGRISAAEIDSLWQTLTAYLGGHFTDSGAIDGFATRLPVESDAEIVIADRRFCLTGEFSFGTRSLCEAAILERGGQVLAGVTKKLDFLVIGRFASPYWVGTSHGRKIEKALTYRTAGVPLRIVAEEHWSARL